MIKSVVQKLSILSALLFSHIYCKMAEGGNDTDKNVPAGRSNSSDEDSSGEGHSSLDKLRELFNKTLALSSKPTGEQKLGGISIEKIAEFMKSDACKNIIVMSGAGVSTSAGIPDFRSPGSGIYANLQKYNLPDPQCIFEISYFKSDPRPFFSLAKELLPSILKFLPVQYRKKLKKIVIRGVLLRVYTQNIDTLERIANIPGEKIVEAHGTFHSSHCLGMMCRKEYSLDWMREKILVDKIPKCPDCGSYIKPDIVFFGESLPRRFFVLSADDFPKCDLLIVMGTSLVVQPFATLVDKVPKDTPRLLINKEKAGEVDPFMRFLGFGSGMDFDSENNYRDVAWLGLCDDGCQELANLLGWGDELKELVKREHDNIDQKKQGNSQS